MGVRSDAGGIPTGYVADRPAPCSNEPGRTVVGLRAGLFQSPAAWKKTPATWAALWYWQRLCRFGWLRLAAWLAEINYSGSSGIRSWPDANAPMPRAYHPCSTITFVLHRPIPQPVNGIHCPIHDRKTYGFNRLVLPFCTENRQRTFGFCLLVRKLRGEGQVNSSTQKLKN